MIRGLFNFRRQPKALPRAPAGARAYAIGDVHGRLDLLDALVAEIHRDVAHREHANVFLVFLGDLIDRGPHSREVIERLRGHRREGIRPVFLIGNHEEVLLRLLAGEQELLQPWLTFGGAETARSYGIDPAQLTILSPAESIELLRRAIPAAHADFIGSFGDTFRFGDYLFVHAGIRPGVQLAEQQQSDLRWIRQPFLDDKSDHGFTVIHGHTISPMVDERSNRIGIDTGAYRTGVLTAIALEDEQRWYLDTAGVVPVSSPVAGRR